MNDKERSHSEPIEIKLTPHERLRISFSKLGDINIKILDNADKLVGFIDGKIIRQGEHSALIIDVTRNLTKPTALSNLTSMLLGSRRNKDNKRRSPLPPIPQLPGHSEIQDRDNSSQSNDQHAEKAEYRERHKGVIGRTFTFLLENNVAQVLISNNDREADADRMAANMQKKNPDIAVSYVDVYNMTCRLIYLESKGFTDDTFAPVLDLAASKGMLRSWTDI